MHTSLPCENLLLIASIALGGILELPSKNHRGCHRRTVTSSVLCASLSRCYQVSQNLCIKCCIVLNVFTMSLILFHYKGYVILLHIWANVRQPVVILHFLGASQRVFSESGVLRKIFKNLCQHAWLILVLHPGFSSAKDNTQR